MTNSNKQIIIRSQAAAVAELQVIAENAGVLADGALLLIVKQCQSKYRALLSERDPAE